MSEARILLRSARAKLSAFHKSKTPIELTHAELDALADDACKNEDALAASQGDDNPNHKRTDFTCHNCASAASCEYIYDPYNTGGDCLASK